MKRLRSFLQSPEFLVILTPFILFAPVLFGKALFWGTPGLQFHPWHVFAWEMLKSGQMPLWNDLSGLGAPLLANYQSALFYPPNWLYFILAGLGGETAMAWGMGFLTAAHLALAGVGMVRLTRSLGLNPVAQKVSGLAFGLSGYLVARAHFLSMNVALAWLPWILWVGFEMVASLKSPKPSVKIPRLPGGTGHAALRLTLYIALLLLAGHAQTAWYTLLLTGVWLIFWTWQFHPRPSALLRAILLFSLVGLFAAALAAVQLLPTAELLSQSQRASGADYDFVMTYSFWPWRVLGLVLPGLFGSPATGDYWGYGNFWEDAIYIGLLPFLLALRTLPAVFKMPKEEVQICQATVSATQLIRLLWGGIALTFLLALGQNTPIFPFLYRHIPTFDVFQAPTRYMIWAEFALTLLAGLGAETWRRPVGKKARTRILRGVVIAAALVLAALAAGWVIPGIKPSFLRATGLAGALGMVAGLFSLFIPKLDQGAYSLTMVSETQETDPQKIHRPPRLSASSLFPTLVGVFVAFDLLLAGWGLNPGITLDFYRGAGENAAQVREMIGDGRLFLPAADEYDLTFTRYLRFNTFHADFTHFRASLLPNLNILDGLASVNNYDPLRPARYVQWMDALKTADDAQQRRMLALMGVTALARYVPEAETGIVVEPLEGGKGRFQWYPCARPAQDAEMAWQMTLAEENVNTVVLEDFPSEVAANAQTICGAQGLSQKLGPDLTAEITVLAEKPHEIRLRVEGDSLGWLLVADTWYPGWTAEVNGVEVPIYRANVLFRAVDIPLGGGEVVMRYQPMGFWVGMAVSGVAWIGWVGWFWWRRRGQAQGEKSVSD